MSKIQWKGSTLLAPLPVVMVSCGSEEKPNIITVAWTGIINSNPPKMYISVRPERFSYEIIKESGEFVVNLVSEKMVRAADFCGIFTGKKIDKFDKNNLHTEISNVVSCPSIEESPISIECKVDRVIPLGSHDMFIAEVVGVTVDDKYMDESGKFNLNDSELVAYSHGEYFQLGEKLGKFGYSVKKEK